MSRPPVVLDHLAVGLVGGMQPDKLARSFEGDEDGMTARFLFAWPAEPDYRALSDDAGEIEPELLTSIQRIVDLVAEDEDGVFAPRAIRLSTEARATFEQFRQLIRRGKGALDGREREWWSKGDGMVLRLAGVLAFLSWSLAVGDPEPTEIDDRPMRDAVTLWHDYYWQHARAAMRQIGMTEKHSHARRALLWIQTNQKTEISVQDIRRTALRSQALTAEKTEALLNQLTREGFLRPTAIKTKGAPKKRWLVNPMLHVSAGSAGSAGRGVEQ